jgi:hypothetical protein
MVFAENLEGLVGWRDAFMVKLIDPHLPSNQFVFPSLRYFEPLCLLGRTPCRRWVQTTVMPGYKFKIGQSVHLTGSPLLGAPAGPYQVTQRLPERDGELQYRIKSPTEGHKRVAKESELRRI